MKLKKGNIEMPNGNEKIYACMSNNLKIVVFGQLRNDGILFGYVKFNKDDKNRITREQQEFIGNYFKLISKATYLKIMQNKDYHIYDL